MRAALAIAAVVAIILACSSVSTPTMGWRPATSMRVVLGGAAAVMAISAWLTGPIAARR